MTRDDRRQLDRHTVKRLLDANYDPYKPSARARANPDTDEYDPDLQARWVFPSIGLRRAARVAGEVSIAGYHMNLSTLRLVTLRLTKERPDPEELGSYLDSLSQNINTHVPYMKAMGWIIPVLSVPQIRLDLNQALDPHLHALWHIAPEGLIQVKKYLEQRYEGGVWIDDKPVRNLKRAAFYIASGMLDYPAVPDWPLAVLLAVWNLGRRRMIRPAGWYADYVKAQGDGRKLTKSSISQIEDGPQRRQEAPGETIVDRGGSFGSRGGGRHPGQDGGLQGVRGSIGPTFAGASRERDGRPRANRRGDMISTVRPAVPESALFNPFATPSVDAFWVVVRLIQSQSGDTPHETLEEFCTRLSLKPIHVRKAVSQVEAHIEATLFFPGGYWTPTAAGAAFLKKALPHMEGLDMLAVELGAEARWARHPGRREFEARMGYGTEAPNPDVLFLIDPKDDRSDPV